MGKIILSDLQTIKNWFVKNITIPVIIGLTFATIVTLSFVFPLLLAYELVKRTNQIEMSLLGLLTLFIIYLWACWFRSESSDYFFDWLEKLEREG